MSEEYILPYISLNEKQEMTLIYASAHCQISFLYSMMLNFTNKMLFKSTNYINYFGLITPYDQLIENKT